MKDSTRNYWLLSGAFFFFFLCWSFAQSLFPIWLNQAVGLDGESTGLIFSVNAFVLLFIAPCYGYIQDKLGLRKYLLYFFASLLVLIGPFFIYVYGPLLNANLIAGAVVGGIYFGFAIGSAIGALETYIDRSGRLTGFEWGRARMWGSLGWAVATFFAGYLFNIDPNINFWLASLAALALLFVFFLVSTEATHSEAIPTSESLKLSDAFHLLQTGRFWALAVYVMGVTCIYSVYDQQFPIYFASLFPTQAEGNAMFGYLNSFQVFLEAGGMFLAPFLVNRIGAKNGLLVAGAIMAIRVLGSGVSDTPVEISAMKLLHAVELPIMLVSLFKYIAATFDQRLTATVYLVGFNFMTQVAASVLSIGVGRMYDKLGFPDSYLILGSIVAFFAVLSLFLLTSDRGLDTKLAHAES